MKSSLKMKEDNLSAAPIAGESAGEQVILANKAFYKEIASKYDHYEYCALDTFFQQVIEHDLDVIENRLSHPRGRIRCLDCGGGTGNVSLKMLRRGWHVTVVDVSSDMLDILKTKASASGWEGVFINDSVENFFSRSPQLYDVVSFSSVLHHLYSPVSVVIGAAGHISPGGFFYSIFDPVPPSSGFAAGCFSSFDTFLAKLIYDRQDFVPGLRRRFRKLSAHPDTQHGRVVVSPGDLAEYHARTGIDDTLLAQTLQQQGFIVDRKRYAVGRTKLVRWLNNHLQVLLNFRILAQMSQL